MRVPGSSTITMVPDQGPFFAPNILPANGLPGFGQVMLAEFVGTIGFVLVSLNIKYMCAEKKSD